MMGGTVNETSVVPHLRFMLNGADKVLLALALGFFALLTVSGNVLVITAISIKPYLHTATNIMLASLAAADLIVGTVVMPPNAVMQITGRWHFGATFCHVWRACDVLASTCSIWNLCLVSIDRYIGVKDAFRYTARVTHRKTGFAVAFVWICSFLLSFPAVIWWGETVSRNATNESLGFQCSFGNDVAYNVFSSLVSFYIPCFIMLFAYCQVFRAARDYRRCLSEGRIRSKSTRGTLRVHKGKQPVKSKMSSLESQSSMEHARVARVDTMESLDLDCISVLEEESLNSPTPSNSHHNLRVRNSNARSNLMARRHGIKSFVRFGVANRFAKFFAEQRAAKTLSVVVGCFILCWLPFFVLNVVYGVCPTCVSNIDLYLTIATWLGHCNSCLNPLIYAYFNENFRRAFKSILKCTMLRKPFVLHS